MTSIVTTLFIYLFSSCDRFFLRVLAFNLRWCVFVSLTRFTIECFDSPNMIGSWSTRRENILNEADRRRCLCTFLWYLVRSILLCRVHVADGDDGKQFDRFLHICTVYSETNARTKSKLSCSSQSVEVHMPCAFARQRAICSGFIADRFVSVEACNAMQWIPTETTVKLAIVADRTASAIASSARARTKSEPRWLWMLLAHVINSTKWIPMICVSTAAQHSHRRRANESFVAHIVVANQSLFNWLPKINSSLS